MALRRKVRAFNPENPLFWIGLKGLLDLGIKEGKFLLLDSWRKLLAWKIPTWIKVGIRKVLLKGNNRKV